MTSRKNAGAIWPWTPNWRDASEYPGPGALATCLAWAFLRRNPEYVHAWQRSTASPGAISREELTRIARSFGLAQLIDPASAQPPRFLTRSPPGKPSSVQVPIEIDLALPIGPQLALIARWARVGAEAWQQAHPRAMGVKPRMPRVCRLIEALRVHDGRSVGASQTEIRSALYPRYEADSGRGRIRRLEKLARTYINGRYRTLVGLDELAAPESHCAPLVARLSSKRNSSVPAELPARFNVACSI